MLNSFMIDVKQILMGRQMEFPYRGGIIRYVQDSNGDNNEVSS